MKEMWKNINKKYIVIGLFILLAVLVIVLGMVGVNSLNNIKCTSETTVGEITIKDEIRIKLVKGKVGYVKENKIIKVSDKSKREEAYYTALEKTIKSAYKYLGEDKYELSLNKDNREFQINYESKEKGLILNNITIKENKEEFDYSYSSSNDYELSEKSIEINDSYKKKELKKKIEGVGYKCA